MSQFRNEIQIFRHRGFEPNDGGPIIKVFGDGPAPVNADGTAMKVLWDNDIEQHTKVSHHVEPKPQKK